MFVCMCVVYVLHALLRCLCFVLVYVCVYVCVGVFVMAPHSPNVGEYALMATDGVRFPFAENQSEKYTLEDVSHHSAPTDCWLVIWGKVYDVTRWYASCSSVTLVVSLFVGSRFVALVRECVERRGCRFWN